jgi:hypothetical protein
MRKELIDQEIFEQLRQSDLLLDDAIIIEFFKSSEIFGKAFEVFEDHFKTIWPHLKNYPMISEFSIIYEKRLKLLMFHQCINLIKADSDLYFTEIKDGGKIRYEINKVNYNNLMNSFREYFVVPRFIVAILQNKSKDLEELLNKRRTYSLELMKMAKEIETTVKPKPTQEQAILWANEKLNIYNKSLLIDKYDKPTQFFIDLKNSYRAQKKSL